MRIKAGEATMPRKLPNAELKIAAASLPPTVLVKMTADETGGGKQANTCNLQYMNDDGMKYDKSHFSQLLHQCQ